MEDKSHQDLINEINNLKEKLSQLSSKASGAADEALEHLENPSPVLRVSKDGIIIFANKASQLFLDDWGCRVGMGLPDDLKEKFTGIYNTGIAGILEIICRGKTYRVEAAPVKNSGYLNVYAYDISESKDDKQALFNSRNKLEALNSELLKAKQELEQSGYELEEVVRRRTHALTVLYEVSNDISYTLDYQRLLKVTMEGLLQVVAYDVCGALVYSKASAAVTLNSVYHDVSHFTETVKESLLDSISLLTGDNIRKKRLNIFIVPSQSGAPKRDKGDYNELKSFINVPFVVRGKTIGVLNVSSCNSNAFSDQDTKFIYTIANLASNTIERLQELVSAQKSKMESMVESMNEGVIMFDGNGEIVVLNPEAKTLLSLEIDAAKSGEPVYQRLEAVGLAPAIKESQKGSKTAVKEIYIPRGNKELIVHCEISPVRDDQKEIIGFVIILRDVTREKEAERMKSEFIATVSHELRTPLTTIREVVSQILDGILGETTQEQTNFLNICLNDIDRLARIINNILDISKIEAGKVELKMSFLDLSEVIQDIEASFKPRVKAQGIDIDTYMSKPSIEAYVDRDKIIQVFTNLVANSLRFTEAGRIGLSVIDRRGWIECSVSDTGCGIRQEDIPKVFDKFTQVDRKEGASEKGTGLGLAIAKSIVELHFGKIWAESEPGKGAKFTFTIPAYNTLEMFKEILNNKILEAKKEYKELSVFAARINNFESFSKGFSEDNAKAFFKRLAGELESICAGGSTFMRIEKDKIIGCTNAKRYDIAATFNRCKRAIKEIIVQTNQDSEIDFSCGYSIYPDHAVNPSDLIKVSEDALASERDERMKKQILIVDDEPVIVESLNRFLTEKGYQYLCEASNGKDALSKIAQNPPDLILLDMQLPAMNGYEVIGRLKEDSKTHDIPIVIMSGYEVDAEKLGDWIDKKTIPMVGKPFNMEHLIRVIEYML
ncbi:MAG: ATP-binding protein [Candidatus Omnitrophota bacterium]